MDAVKFIEERRRTYRATGKRAPTLAEWIPAEDVVKEVEAWSAAHPRKTRQTTLLEQYPEALVDERGTLGACPMLFPQNTGTRAGAVQSLIDLVAIAAKNSGHRRWSDGKSVSKHRQRTVDCVGRVLFPRTEEVE